MMLPVSIGHTFEVNNSKKCLTAGPTLLGSLSTFEVISVLQMVLMNYVQIVHSAIYSKLFI